MIGINFNSNRYVPRNTIFTITDIRPVNILSMPSEDNRILCEISWNLNRSFEMDNNKCVKIIKKYSNSVLYHIDEVKQLFNDNIWVKI